MYLTGPRFFWDPDCRVVSLISLMMKFLRMVKNLILNPNSIMKSIMFSIFRSQHESLSPDCRLSFWCVMIPTVTALFWNFVFFLTVQCFKKDPRCFMLFFGSQLEPGGNILIKFIQSQLAHNFCFCDLKLVLRLNSFLQKSASEVGPTPRSQFLLQHIDNTTFSWVSHVEAQYV